jgi:signal peptidase complex subunit 1
MDYKGQRLSELMYQVTIGIFGVVAFLVGYLAGSFRAMMLTFGAGVVLAIVIAVPDWPYFNQHPQRWLSVEDPKAGKGTRGEEAVLARRAEGTACRRVFPRLERRDAHEWLRRLVDSTPSLFLSLTLALLSPHFAPAFISLDFSFSRTFCTRSTARGSPPGTPSHLA